MIATGLMIAIVPVILVYAFFSERLIQGMTAGRREMIGNRMMAVVTLDTPDQALRARPRACRRRGVARPSRDGEFMVLLGPSGCGKTTTLRMIAGLESISSGTARRSTGASSTQVPAKDRDIAMVFQSYALYPHMSVHDNLAFGLRRRAVDRAEIDRRVAAVAGDARPRRAARPQAACALRRPAPARRARPGDRARSQGVSVRRAAVEPRRRAARLDAQRDRPSCTAGSARR